MSRFQFVADHSATFEVKRLCQLLEVERSSYYAWKAAAPARQARADADAALAERIRAVHDEDTTCGAPRITAELNDGAPAGQRVNHKRVARVMRREGIRGYVKKRRVRTTIPEPSGQKYPDLLQRDFTADAPNRRYVGDITYLPLADGTNLYLATVIDCHSRRLAGWAVADHMRTSLVEDALHAAAATRGSLTGAIFHSDHGSVYCSKAYATLCTKLGVTQSMGAVGSCLLTGQSGAWERDRCWWGRVVGARFEGRDVVGRAHGRCGAAARARPCRGVAVDRGPGAAGRGQRLSVVSG